MADRLGENHYTGNTVIQTRGYTQTVILEITLIFKGHVAKIGHLSASQCILVGFNTIVGSSKHVKLCF